MAFLEALFWFGIAALGVGPFFIFPEGKVKRAYGITLTVLGILACAYSVYRHYHSEVLPQFPLWIILWAFTWLLLGYDIYVRRRSSSVVPQSEADELYADTIFAWLRANIHAAGTFSAAGLAHPVGLSEDAVNRGLELLRSKYQIVTKPSPALDSWSYNAAAAVHLQPKYKLVPSLPSDTTKTSKLVIHAADYRAWNGAGEKFDVTEFMRKIVTGNSLVHDPIENDNFSIDGKNYVPRDPLFGQPKRLQVTYSYGGEAQRTVRRTEHGRITLPEDSAIDWLGSELDKAKTEAEKWKRTYAESESTNHTMRELIAKDVANLGNRILEHKRHIEFHFSPSSDPYLDIATELWNGSVFDLVSFGEIAGHVTYAGKQLAGEPRVVVSVEPALLNLRHGESLILVVRQYLSSQVADAMVTSQGRSVAIDFQSVFVSFKVLPRILPSDGTTYRWQGPRFAIEDAKRV